jgi:hypothetical protein
VPRILSRRPAAPATAQESTLPALLLHQSLDAFAADPDAVTAQLPVHPVSAVGAPGSVPDLEDIAQQAKVDQIPVTRLFGLLDPLVVGRLGNVQDP